MLNNGNVFKTTNSGLNWIQLSTVVVTGLKTGIQFINDATGWVITGQSNLQGIYKTTNGGNNWFIVNDPDVVAYIPFDIDLLNNDKGWIAKMFGMLTLVNDSVLGIQSVPLPLPRLKAIDMTDTTNGYAAGGVLLKTTDGGGPITSIGNESNQLSESYSLIRNYPNPFNSKTVVRYLIKEPGLVSIEVFDIAGKLISSLLKDVMTLSGEHEIIFDAQTLASGVYICVLNARSRTGKEAYSRTVRMLLVK